MYASRSVLDKTVIVLRLHIDQRDLIFSKDLQMLCNYTCTCMLVFISFGGITKTFKSKILYQFIFKIKYTNNVEFKQYYFKD